MLRLVTTWRRSNLRFRVWVFGLGLRDLGFREFWVKRFRALGLAFGARVYGHLQEVVSLGSRVKGRLEKVDSLGSMSRLWH